MMKKIIGVSTLLTMIMLVSACSNEVPGENLNETVATTEVAETTETQAAAEPEETTAEAKEEPVGEERPPAADFTMTDWQGNTVSLSDYRGKIVFLNFFATWCPPCEKEMPEFEQAYQDYGGDVVFLIIDVFTSERTDLAGVEQWWVDGGYTMPMIIDVEGDLNDDYPVRAFPTTFVIDREGGVLGYLEGGMDRAMVDQILDQVE